MAPILRFKDPASILNEDKEFYIRHRPILKATYCHKRSVYNYITASPHHAMPIAIARMDEKSDSF